MKTKKPRYDLGKEYKRFRRNDIYYWLLIALLLAGIVWVVNHINW